MTGASFVRFFPFFFILSFGFSVLCYSQAWIPPKGTGSLAFSYQLMEVDYHLDGNGTKDYAAGQIDANNVIADFSYSLTDKLAFSLGIPFVTSKYNGTRPHRITGADGSFTVPIDDGSWHSTFQDFSFQLRYNVLTGSLQITPFVRVILPSHDYSFFGHAAPGIHTRRIQLGTYVGRTLDPVIPNAYVQGRYSFGFNEKVLDISSQVTNADLEFGYFMTESLRGFGLVVGQVTHGGIDVPNSIPPPEQVSTNPRFFHHDQISGTNYLNVGAGASYSLNRSIDVYGAYAKTVRGQNLHAIKHGITFGVSYGFRGFRPPDAKLSASYTDERKKFVCLCAVKDHGAK